MLTKSLYGLTCVLFFWLYTGYMILPTHQLTELVGKILGSLTQCLWSVELVLSTLRCCWEFGPSEITRKKATTKMMSGLRIATSPKTHIKSSWKMLGLEDDPPFLLKWSLFRGTFVYFQRSNYFTSAAQGILRKEERLEECRLPTPICRFRSSQNQLSHEKKISSSIVSTIIIIIPFITQTKTRVKLWVQQFHLILTTSNSSNTFFGWIKRKHPSCHSFHPPFNRRENPPPFFKTSGIPLLHRFHSSDMDTPGDPLCVQKPYYLSLYC